MEKEKLESIIKVFADWNAQWSKILNASLVPELKLPEFPIDIFQSMNIDKVTLLDPYKNLLDSIKATSPNICPAITDEDNPEPDKLYYWVMYSVPKIILQDYSLPHHQLADGETEEERLAHFIQESIKAIETAREAMKHDEQEIAQIQADTQRILKMIEAA